MAPMKKSILLTAVACFWITGCSKNDPSPSPADQADSVIDMDQLPPLSDPSGHPEHGPRGGELIELGNEAFHIEMTHSDSSVSFYVLDGAAKNPVGIEAQKLTVSLKHDGEVKSFDLPATPQADDEPGKSSHFASTDEELEHWLEAGAEGVVIVDISGKSYTGQVSHDHDHGHDDHEGHDH
ncbi:hypothetical protein SAMN06265222_1011009 [Neorhodopirellula lusitana]|uniref:Uncharacterized protein n=2 Tax=Neorhodopirellula lusitana TaxID=445327 RepID=A0ABY1PST4_9BACT|nr:hypothetical protein SAMN06265222_1011009 [Neorhodopirellula lusitana]